MTSEGRISVKRDGGGAITAYEYEYFYKDHLGNVRAVWTSAPDPLVFNTGMENSPDPVFDNIYQFTSTAFNKTAGGNKVLQLTNTDNVGANLVLTVMPGDEIDLNVWSTYTNSGTDGSTQGLVAMIGYVAGAFGGVQGGGGEAGAIYDAVSEALGVIGLGGTQGTTKTACYLNYIVFDRNLEYQFGGFINTVSSSASTMQQFSLNDINITQPGYIYIYLSNESVATTKLAFFDEFNVTLTRPVIQSEEYYPFGMTIAENSYNNILEAPNKFLYNSNEWQDEQNAHVYDFNFRMYDPALGRFLRVDPLAEITRMQSPFQFGNNNPIRFNDPFGLLVNPGFTESVFAIIEQAWNDTPNPGGGSSGGYYTYSNGQRTSATTWVLNKPKPGGQIAGTFRSNHPDLVNASLEEAVSYTMGQALNSIEVNNSWGNTIVDNRQLAISALASVTGISPGMMWGLMLQEIVIKDTRIREYAGDSKASIYYSIMSGMVSTFGLGVESTIADVGRGAAYATKSGLAGLKVMSSGLVGANLAISSFQFIFNENKNPSDYARYITNLAITGTAFIPVAGPFISFGLTLAESTGAFEGFYRTFNDPLMQWIYLESLSIGGY
ncbi:MAG TPA: RHS repeat-associated core domain-containing protein [Cyclobacteriaceae bacterium]|nr:RHS repeat-associated core domain-containing protein [Cyclobacteriaceae bacterium]